MALHDLAIMTVSGTPGTGTITLGAATDGGVTFAAAGVVTGELVPYGIIDGSNRETGMGVYTASGTTLTRNLIASTTGSLLSLTSAAVVFITAGAADLGTNMLLFGDGSDGAYPGGAVTLSRDVYYSSMTPIATDTLVTNGWRVFCNGNCDLSNAGAGFLKANGGNGGVGSAGAAGSFGTGAAVNSVGGSGNASPGGAGGTGVGAQGTVTGSNPAANGGASGISGKGGNGTPNAGGASRPSVAATLPLAIRKPQVELIRGIVILSGGVSGAGASAGGGDGTNTGRGPGGSGAGGGVLFLAARTITTGGSTAAGAIQAIGGSGGNGAPTPSGNVGGGGGGSGGGGGWAYIIYGTKVGTPVSALIWVDGGTGGNGSNGAGTGAGGDGGGGGGCGRITLVNVGAATASEPIAPGSAAAAGAAGAVNAGGTGTAGVQGRAAL